MRQSVERRSESSAPAWAPAAAMTGGWSPDEGLVPFGAELPFELPDVMAESRLRDAQPPRCATETLLLGEDCQIADVP